MHCTHAKLIYGDDGPITEDEFRMWPQYYRAKNWLDEQAQKKASKGKGRGQGKRFRY
jgi:hypothetical protein